MLSFSAVAQNTVDLTELSTDRDFPKFVWVWGFFGGKYPGENLEGNRVHYAEQSALSDSRFKNQRPFYAKDITPTEVTCSFWDDKNKIWIRENRYADTDWSMSDADMAMSIEYLVRSGLQYFNFIYYPDNNIGGIVRILFEKTLNKRGIKAAFTVGVLGGDRDKYPAPNDYTRNLKHLVDCLSKDWYQKIEGKPIVFYYNQESETLADLSRIRAAYGGPMYEVFLSSGYSNDYTFIVKSRMDARSWYYVFNNEANGNHSLNSVISETYACTKQILQAGFNVVPSMTIALDQRARQNYPGDSPAWNKPGYMGHSHSYYEPISEIQLNKYFADLEELRRLYPKQLKTAGFSTWDELSEGGRSCLMPKKRIDGTVDDTMVGWFQKRDK